MEKKGILLANQFIYEGYIIGDVKEPVGFELCFNTSMTGYQEIITDPSYLGQVIVFTTPHIGNVGCNSMDMESNNTVRGVIVKEKPSSSSSWRAERNFKEWCIKNKVFCFYGVDTRSLVEKIRKKEISVGVIGYADSLDNLLKIKQKQYNTENKDLASLACGDEKRSLAHKHNFIKKNIQIAVIDCGIKNNILNCLYEQGFDLSIYPCKAIEKYKDEINMADGLFLSNGPGDPRSTLKNVSLLEELIKSFTSKSKPIFGICLGHQILSLVFGIDVIKMSQGHRGGNQPVLDTISGRVHITAQNHGFAVVKNDYAIEKYVSLFDNIPEGFVFKDKKIISVQYHPESSPGPRDSRYIFQEFRKFFV
ncbi:MAG: glutamine-hydrolyzing carbamoyl-phosphate synthase small subunit [Rickettsiales bacterium]|jgi:carbamoyl-phosphate synthase small subunit|nr:glutamine-hydrolyzing carbamoyl-phosphate synthase small subunit [Rickettsiales bacterium]